MKKFYNKFHPEVSATQREDGNYNIYENENTTYTIQTKDQIEYNPNWVSNPQVKESVNYNVPDDNLSSINPDHYKTGGKQVWEMMVELYGVEKYKAFCELNSFKYRMRAGKKSSKIYEDIKKAMWYESKLEEL
jgi:hypothetical protein